MARRTTDGEVDTLALSFLDLISCGLGAAIVLSLVYSLVGDSPAVNTTAPRFLDVTLVVEDTNTILNVYVKSPHPEATGFFIDLQELDVPSGRMSSTFCNAHPVAKRITLVGFSRFGEQLLTAPNQPPRQYLNVMIEDPAPGDWVIEALFRDKRDWNAGANEGTVTRRVVLRHKQPDESVPKQLRFGEQTTFGRIQVESR